MMQIEVIRALLIDGAVGGAVLALGWLLHPLWDFGMHHSARAAVLLRSRMWLRASVSIGLSWLTSSSRTGCFI